ncbi:histone-lysine N-methyltransferase, H3 lysine-9 specific SUVH5-like [Chenopodium quinoa]|uniref:histone-lysine N-methyltransferase, H3 lysine-9 specific SUVH5-like n=1 Tax=Chenopodium quinoa TaxID=63459 RepID=UPI000B79A4D0|nr:histone-lysine N-methyltransferase, H3 lysine-9 specific SUVH5-like [Chenopodium quinoa]
MEFSTVKRVHHYARDFPPGCGSNSPKTNQKPSEKPAESEKIPGFCSNSTAWRRSVPAVRSKPPIDDGVAVKIPQNVKGKALPGLGFDAFTERSAGDRKKEKVDEMKKSQNISRERGKVLEMVELFRKRCKEISMSGRGIRRINTVACAELRKEGKISNQSTLMIGAVPGVEVGDKFHYRVELAFVGLHKHYERDIDTMEWGGGRLATCIVASERHLDKMNDPNALVYIGEGGVLRRNKTGKPPDQELKGGNKALWNNKEENKPVRVVRGLTLDRRYGQKILYVYDGLYEVQTCIKKKGPSGNMIYEFQLTRCAGQPAVPWQSCRRYQF